ncbi:MAG: response regulator transcription factor [Clostridia bacterium]|nr:response regulator transcription factor [Clostridia bacterium]
MLKLAVCDDDPVFADLLSKSIKDVFDGLDAQTEISVFSSARAFLAALRSKDAEPDVAFLDIDMPGVSGFEIAGEIKQMRKKTVIVFVSGKHELVFESLDYHPFSFIRKGSGDVLLSDLGKVAAGIVRDFLGSKTIEINDVYAGKVRVCADDILTVSSEDHYLVYVVMDSGRPYKERGTLRAAEEKLRQYGFFRPHHQHLVNAAHVSFFNPKFNKLILDTKASVPVSRSLRASAHESYLKLKRVF